MKLNQREADFLRAAIRQWVDEGLLSEEQARRLEEGLQVSSFNWRGIAQAAFVVAVVFGVISLVIILRQELLVRLFYRLINAPYSLLSLVFALVSAGFYWWGWWRKRHRPLRRYTNEVLLLTGGAGTGVAIAFFGQAAGMAGGYYAPLYLLAAVLYLVLGRGLPSAPLWLTGLGALGVWFGVETAYQSGPGPDLFLGMNQPLRFSIFGLALAAAGLALRRTRWTAVFAGVTYLAGLLCLFTALWLVSIFGNHAGWESWRAAPWWEFALYSAGLALVAAAAVWWGARREDHLLRGIGIIFFLLNGYTKFVEHGWDHLHRALFFAILAASFWLIGRRAERIWYFDPSSAEKPNHTI